MGRIQANTGIISGIPIVQTVDQLMKIQARPRDLLVSRAKDLQAQQVAVTELMATVIGVQLAARNLAKPSVFEARTVKSSHPALITAVAAPGSTPTPGSYRFTPVRQASSQQLLSSGFASQSEPIGAGEFTVGFGGYVDQGIALSELNGNEGITRGKIRITDRSGASAVVDLRFVQTVDDVLQAINTTDAIQVSAVARGDRIELIDRTNATTSNLKVSEVNGGSTAADLGLAGIDVAASEAAGQDILRLANSTSLARLNDGNGLSFRKELADLNVTLADGSTLALDFQRKATNEAFATATTNGGANAQVKLTAKTKGAASDGVTLQFVDDPGVTAGAETVVYDDSDPEHKTLTVHIAAGASTATNVIDAINNHAAASALFTAANATGSSGTGIVTASDTAVTRGGAALAARNETNIGALLQTINETDPAKLKAELSASGDRIVLTDLTSGGGTFAVTSTVGGTLAEDLGLTGSAVGNTLESGRLLGGLKTTLLRTLGGGSGLGEFGALHITDRSGATASVDLSSAETLDDVLAAINAAPVGVEAKFNAARNGIEIADTTGAAASNLIVASGDATETAKKLKIEIDAAQASVRSGSLQRQSISEQTLLSSLNGGKGIARTSFFVNDSTGKTGVVRLDDESIQTVGDLITLINAQAIGVQAKLSSSGDGIELVDTAGGAGLPGVRDIGTGTAAKDLHFGTAVEETVGATTTKVIRASQTRTVTVSATDTLQDVADKLNQLGGGFTASILSDGSGVTPFRLSIQSNIVGTDGNLLLDSSYGSVKFEELSQGRDALLQLGASDTGAGVLISSKTNTFENAAPNVNLTLVGQSTDTVTVTVAQSDASAVSTLQLFVDSYNKLQDKLEALTFFNEAEKSTGVLFGSLEALRIDTELGSLMSGRFFGVGNIKSMKELGIDLTDAGKLTFDSAKFQEKYAADPNGVKEFFTTDKLGFADKMDDLTEDFSGVKNSLLVSKAASLQSRIDIYNDKVGQWEVRLNLSREALLKKFYNLETALGKLQNNLSAVGGIQAIPPLGSVPR